MKNPYITFRYAGKRAAMEVNVPEGAYHFVTGKGVTKDGKRVSMCEVQRLFGFARIKEPGWRILNLLALRRLLPGKCEAVDRVMIALTQIPQTWFHIHSPGKPMARILKKASNQMDGILESITNHPSYKVEYPLVEKFAHLGRGERRLYRLSKDVKLIDFNVEMALEALFPCFYLHHTCSGMEKELQKKTLDLLFPPMGIERGLEWWTSLVKNLLFRIQVGLGKEPIEQLRNLGFLAKNLLMVARGQKRKTDKKLFEALGLFNNFCREVFVGGCEQGFKVYEQGV